MSQSLRALILALTVVCLVGCGPRRPDFSVDDALSQLAEAFETPPEEVSVLDEGKAPKLEGESDAAYRARAEIWVDFKVPAFNRTLQARFMGTDSGWELDGVRSRPRGSRLTPWSEVGEMLGEVRAAASDKAEATMELMRELGNAVEALAVDSENRFPTTDIQGLARLLTRGRYLEKWKHRDDGWGNTFHYYAADAGDAYIIVSRGADNRFDLPVDDYNTRADAYDFDYAGAHSDPALDLIYATGSFVQLYIPGE